ncbi:CTP synthase [Trichinella spiralis]|uniref:CTP synthase n=1 Tax=Trichinella spiralis TaxID=6334 RepID=A0ABR3KQ72_TRISP
MENSELPMRIMFNVVMRQKIVIIPLSCDDEEGKTSRKCDIDSNNAVFSSQIEIERDEDIQFIQAALERQLINLELEDGVVTAEASDESPTEIHCENNAIECVAKQEENAESFQDQKNKLKTKSGTNENHVKSKRRYLGKIITPSNLRQVTFDIEWFRFGEYQVTYGGNVDLATLDIVLYCRELCYTIGATGVFDADVSILANIVVPLSNIKAMAFTDNSIVLALKKPASVKLAYPKGFSIFDGNVENSTVHHFKLRQQAVSVEILRKLIKFDANLKDRLVTLKSGLGIVYKESGLPCTELSFLDDNVSLISSEEIEQLLH